MPALDHGFKEIARHAGPALARVAGLECEGWSPIESTLQKTTERLADRAFRSKVNGIETVVYMEFIAEWNPDDLWGYQTKAALLSEKERLPTLCLLFVLQPKGFATQNGTWQLRSGLGPTQQLWFVEVPLWEMEPDAWWESQAYLMPIYPLLNHHRSERDAIVHAAEVIDERATGPAERSDLTTLLTIFGEFISPKLGVAQMLTLDDIYRNSTVGQLFETEFNRKGILRILRSRFPEEDLSVVTTRLEAMKDLARLEELFGLALDCKTFAEFAKHLKPKRKKKT